MRLRSRSRSPRLTAPALEAREVVLTDFARLYWMPPDAPTTPPWTGKRAAEIEQFREYLAAQADRAACNLPDRGFSQLSRDLIVRWQRFTFFEDLARMSDVLFRGPIQILHAEKVDLALHNAWRCIHRTIIDFIEEFNEAVFEFRVSAVRVSMMLETARPPESNQLDNYYELPDARTLSSLLSLRCEKDDPEELIEMYRLVCQKLIGVLCPYCGKPFDECSSAGFFDGAETLVVPVSVPKVFVPQCGHAIHTLCFGSQLIPDHNVDAGIRGLCCKCGLPYGWTAIDLDPMLNAFCLLFGPYVDKRTKEMGALQEVSHAAVLSIAEICQSFSMEIGDLVSPSAAWITLIKRHAFADPITMEIVGEMVLKLLEHKDAVQRTGGEANPAEYSDCETECDKEEHVTEVFLPEPTPQISAEYHDELEDGLPPVPDDSPI